MYPELKPDDVDVVAVKRLFDDPGHLRAWAEHVDDVGSLVAILEQLDALLGGPVLPVTVIL